MVGGGASVEPDVGLWRVIVVSGGGSSASLESNFLRDILIPIS